MKCGRCNKEFDYKIALSPGNNYFYLVCFDCYTQVYSGGKMKVYCKNCKWLNDNFNQSIGYVPACRCEHHSNVEKKFIPSALWYDKIYKTEYVQEPKEKNKHNNCPWFEKEVVE